MMMISFHRERGKNNCLDRVNEKILAYQCRRNHKFNLWLLQNLISDEDFTLLLNCRRLLKAVSCHHRSSSFVPPSAVPTLVPPPAVLLFANPSRCFVKRSAVLFFESTRLTDRRFSRIHCCIYKHRISMCLSPPGLLSCRMCLTESESISRRTETL